jgi:hypothetical protein
MECKPQVTKNTFEDLKSPDDKLNILYDMQASTMECIENVSRDIVDVKKVVEKRKYFDKGATLVGGIVGGILGSLGIKMGT